MNITIAIVSWAEAQQELCRIRTDVFMCEQGVSADDEWDGCDQQATHFLVTTQRGETVATARVLREHHDGKDYFHIGRVAVQKSSRGQGTGQYLMQHALAWCGAENPNATIYLHAQAHSTGFYERLGFVTQGDGFIDAGIAHLEMVHRI